jgi:hypothetical protein
MKKVILFGSLLIMCLQASLNAGDDIDASTKSRRHKKSGDLNKRGWGPAILGATAAGAVLAGGYCAYQSWYRPASTTGNQNTARLSTSMVKNFSLYAITRGGAVLMAVFGWNRLHNARYGRKSFH